MSKHGRIVGRCRECNAQAREAFVEIQDIKDALGERRLYKHTAWRRTGPKDPGRPCHGAVVPTQEYLNPPPQQLAIDAWSQP